MKPTLSRKPDKNQPYQANLMKPIESKKPGETNPFKET